MAAAILGQQVLELVLMAPRSLDTTAAEQEFARVHRGIIKRAGVK